MAKITIKELESLTANDAGRILREDGNLAGRISLRKDGVSVSFFYRYRWGDQNKEYACGSWPRKSLTDIRKARNQARALIDEQINPNEQKKTAKAQAHAAANVEAEHATLTVQDLASAWLLDGVARKDGNAELQRRFNKDLFPSLGRTAVNNVSEHDVRALIRTVVNRGAHRQAISFFADLTQMFSWARKRQPWRALLIEGDPTELVNISPLIPANYEAERSRILSPAELLELHNRFQQMTADYDALPAGQKYDGIRPLKKETQLALWISLGTLCRIGELLQAEWKNVDLDHQTWLLPSENVKGTRGKKQDHHVFLSPFALHFFEELKILTGDSQWCFPNKLDDGHVDVKVVSKQVGDRQARFKNRKALSRRCHDDTLVLADGQNGDWTPHDLRRTGATMMQALGVSLDVIDRCQNHVLAGSRVRRHYLHHDYANEKKNAWNLLGDRLSAVLSSTYEHTPDESMLSFPSYYATESLPRS
ncbi:tyrosine-type recombinase/integrase [Pseudomonas marginalis]